MGVEGGRNGEPNDKEKAFTFVHFSPSHPPQLPRPILTPSSPFLPLSFPLSSLFSPRAQSQFSSPSRCILSSSSRPRSLSPSSLALFLASSFWCVYVCVCARATHFSERERENLIGYMRGSPLLSIPFSTCYLLLTPPPPLASLSPHFPTYTHL